MFLGRVAGTVVATVHHPFYGARRLLLVDKVHPDGTPTGDYVIAVDTVDSGAGETVLVIDEGNSSRQVLGDPSAPVRAVIVGVVYALYGGIATPSDAEKTGREARNSATRAEFSSGRTEQVT